jgi:Uma2 family endonuclease
MVEQFKMRVKAAEFWQMTEASDKRWELIEGEVIEMATPIPTHQDSVGNTYVMLRDIAKLLGARVFFAPLEVYLDDENIPQPDVMLLLKDSRCVVGAKRLEGPPDLIVEVFSPSTRGFDKTTKFRLYERFGVREYWMVDPEALYVEVWTWTDGHYAPLGTFLANETFTSPVLEGQNVQVAAIFSPEAG